MERKYLSKPKHLVSLPNLINVQTNSYEWFLADGLKELFAEISPVDDFTGQNLSLEFGDYFLDKPKCDEETARTKNLTYEAPLRCKVTLYNKISKKKKTSDVFLGNFPLMTPQGYFIINGIKRVVVSQIVRSYGVLFVSERISGRKLFGAKIIPSRGAWLEFETSPRDVISVKIDRKRKIPVTSLLRIIGLEKDEDIIRAFDKVDDNGDHQYIKSTLARDPAKTYEEALVEVYKRARPGDLATPDSAKSFLEAMFFNPKRYNLGRVGRYKINQRLGTNADDSTKNKVLRLEDVVAVIKEIIDLNNNPLAEQDDVDHLKNRRIRAVGELIQGRLRVGLLRMERIIKDRMSVLDPDMVVPSQLINSRPIQAVLQEFFASSQMSQFMNQTNPLAELEHKRTLSATGPGGLSRERAGFEVRDVHPSHYGRICPIESPEGPNIGLVSYLSCYSQTNEFGFLMTPYFKVEHKNGKTKVTNNVVYLDAGEEDKAIIAPSSVKLDKDGYIIANKTVVRKFGEPTIEKSEKVNYVDVSPKQTVSIPTTLIPFLEHDDAARAMMGSNMQRQAVPLVNCKSPYVGTGMEANAAFGSGQVTYAPEDGTITAVSSNEIVLQGKEKHTIHLQKFVRSNQATCINQKPLVVYNQKVKKGQVIADGASTDNGELALGQNVLVAFMSFRGCNYEDAIVISERLVKEDIYTSIHIEKYSIEIRDTKLGPEIITQDIPNVGEEALANLDEQGIVRIGAEVSAGDILVGKISPKGETELSAEEKLLRAIFGEKAKDVKDTSLRLPHGEKGKVVDIKVFSKEAGDELPAGVYQMVEVSVAQLRKVSVGDKLAGRHGNKGVISKILPAEEMPYLPDGTPVDIVLNPLGVISRMNLGQVLETHLGWAAHSLGFKVATPVFEGVTHEQIQEQLKIANLPQDGKITLLDGATGEEFDKPTTVGIIYMIKLCHMVDDKMHARSIGPYSMVTQQPLGGKAQFGGQRFGEMEVWALEAYGVAHTLQEMLTIKSDDVVGRSKAYEAIIKNEPIQKPSIPASFYVLMRELQSLALDIEVLSKGKELATSTQEKDIDNSAGEVQKHPKTPAKKSDVPKESESDKEEEKLTEFMSSQEKNPPQASEEEIDELEKGKQ